VREGGTGVTVVVTCYSMTRRIVGGRDDAW